MKIKLPAAIYLIVVTASLFLSACGQQQGSSAEGIVKSELYKLATMHGCTECHRINATVIGPSWMAIAERYQGAPTEEARELLIERVKKGSQGNWYTWKGGNGMPPLEKRVSADAIEKLVDYILSLRQPAK